MVWVYPFASPDLLLCLYSGFQKADLLDQWASLSSGLLGSANERHWQETGERKDSELWVSIPLTPSLLGHKGHHSCQATATAPLSRAG